MLVMKEFKGTPGPWNAVRHYEDCLIVLDSNGYEIVTAESVSILNDYANKLGVKHWSDDEHGCIELTREQQAANAQIIAASPELLSALQRLLEIYDDQSGKVWTTSSKSRALDNARAAVNKALGEEK